MPVYPVTIPATADPVVPEGVGIPNTDGTRHVLLTHAEPKPILQAESELPVMEMKTQSGGRGHVQPVASMWEGRGEGQGSRACVGGRNEEVDENSIVDAVAEGALSYRDINLLQCSPLRPLSGYRKAGDGS